MSDNPFLPAKRGSDGVVRYDPTEREKWMAAMAHVSILFSMGLAAPVIWLLFRGSSAFVARHAGRASLTHLLGGAAVVVLGTLTCGVGYVLALPLVGFSMWEAKNAWQGKWDAFKAKASS